MPYESSKHGPERIVGPGFRERVYEVVKTVPRGFVTTYGDVAARLGLRSVARHVGFALAALPPERDDVPWHRVVNGQGHISARGEAAAEADQRLLLVEEGVDVTLAGKVASFRRTRHVY